MSLPTTATLGVKRREVGAVGSHGKQAITFAEPIDWPVTAIAPGANEEPANPNRDLSLVLWTVYAAAHANQPTELDRVVLDGVEYAVEGRLDDWTRGPWTHPTAGSVVRLKRAEG